jgi:hypothetical protein
MKTNHRYTREWTAIAPIFAIVAAVVCQAAIATTDIPPVQPPSKTSAAAIPSTNPDDVKKHSAWRKRKADAQKSELQALKRQMIKQAEESSK